jgi:hypothetical protein
MSLKRWPHSPRALPRLVLCALASSCAAQASAEVGNLIPDGYFSYGGQAAEWQQPHYPVVVGSAAWSEVDAGGAPGGGGSGSLAVTLARRSAFTYYASTCVAVAPDAAYTMAVDVLLAEIPPGQQGRAALELRFFMRENCWGIETPSDAVPVEVTEASPDWQHVATDFVAPHLAASVLLTASVSHGNWPDAVDLRAHFDNVSVVGEVPADLPPRLYIGGSSSAEARKGQFAVSATWRAPDGSTGIAQPLRLTADAGGLWFFDPANLEVVVKVLDSCTTGLGEYWWVFIAGMTDLEVEVTITDLFRAETRTYSSPGGAPFQPVVDTSGFYCEPTFP